MVCGICRKHQRRPKKTVPGKAVWVDVPCCSITLQAVKRHQASDSHKEAQAFERELAISSSQIERGIEKEVTVNRLVMEKAMRCLYWLCKEELQHTTKYSSLLDLCKMLGVNELNALKQSGNASYTSERFVQEVLLTFHSFIMKQQRIEAQNSPYYTLLVDETTYVSVKKELIIYIKYLNQQSESETHFSQITSLKDGKAQTITDSIKEYIRDHSLDINKLCGLGSDGAAVMVGVKGGVAALLKTEVPHLLSNHCVAHRLALASSQAANSIPYLKKFKAIVEQLYRFYQYSPVRTAALHDIQEVLNDSKVKVTQAKDVRWLSHDKAIHSIRKTFDSVLVSLERESQERSDVQAMGLSVFLQTYSFVASMLMMCDVLPVLSQLSRAMQKRDLDYSLVKPLVAATVNTITKFKTIPGVYFSTIDRRYQELSQKPYKFTQKDDQKEKFMAEVYQPFLDKIVEKLERRFPDLPLVECLSLFDTSLIPEDEEERAVYGHDSLKRLSDHFNCNFEETKVEWMTVLQFMITQGYQPQSSTMTSIARQSDSFPNIGKIAAAGLLIPTSTADCERGFSTLKRVKTELRNKLSTKILNCLLAISLEGKSVETFEICDCVSMWSKDKQRRIQLS